LKYFYIFVAFKYIEISFYLLPMNYKLLYDIIDLMEDFEINSNEYYPKDINGFKKWISDEHIKKLDREEPDWEGKENGRSPESVISTLFVHLNRYGKSYSRSLMYDSPFSSQDDFIFLINLKAFGPMTKMELIKKNIQDKPAGIQIINRLIKQGWVEQHDSDLDKRKKVIHLTESGVQILEEYMDKIRMATNIVSGNLLYSEKIQLINLLSKLDFFHKQIFEENIYVSELLDKANEEYLRVNK